MCRSVIKGTGFSRVLVRGPLISGGHLSLIGQGLPSDTGQNRKGFFGVVAVTRSGKGNKNEDGGLVWTVRGTRG